jgi:hypothetical protein
MKRRVTYYLIALGFVISVTPRALAEQQRPAAFTSIDFPDALATLAADISAAGDVVGRYCLNPSCLQDVTGGVRRDRDEPAAQYGSSPDSPLEGTGESANFSVPLGDDAL